MWCHHVKPPLDNRSPLPLTWHPGSPPLFLWWCAGSWATPSPARTRHACARSSNGKTTISTDHRIPHFGFAEGRFSALLDLAISLPGPLSFKHLFSTCVLSFLKHVSMCLLSSPPLFVHLPCLQGGGGLSDRRVRGASAAAARAHDAQPGAPGHGHSGVPTEDQHGLCT